MYNEIYISNYISKGKKKTVTRKNVGKFFKILDFFVSGKKKCRKNDPCVKMSENWGKNVRKFP